MRVLIADFLGLFIDVHVTRIHNGSMIGEGSDSSFHFVVLSL